MWWGYIRFGVDWVAKRFSKTDWLDLGLKTLAESGMRAIRIDTLCAKAGRTKGSFYHHFKARKDFVSALMVFWADRLTEKVIHMTENEDSPVARLIALNKIALNMEYEIDRELRRWAASDIVVREAIEAIDKRRVDYVASLLMQAKNITSQQAIDLAVMNYVSLIGFQQMFSPVSAERRIRIDRIFVEILNTLPDHD